MRNPQRVTRKDKFRVCRGKCDDDYMTYAIGESADLPKGKGAAGHQAKCRACPERIGSNAHRFGAIPSNERMILSARKSHPGIRIP